MTLVKPCNPPGGPSWTPAARDNVAPNSGGSCPASSRATRTAPSRTWTAPATSRDHSRIAFGSNLRRQIIERSDQVRRLVLDSLRECGIDAHAIETVYPPLGWNRDG